jgi:uncharacterized membrane protein
MESHRRVKSEEERIPPASDLPPGLGSLLPPDADDEEDAFPPAGQSERANLADRSGASAGPLAPSTSQPASRPAGQTRDLNEVVHQILVVGLLISTALLVIGLITGLLAGHTLPPAAMPPGSALQQALKLDPSGFISLGMLVLIFTPIVRVIGSVFVFLYERDWLYFGVTLFVLMVMLVSVILGRV